MPEAIQRTVTLPWTASACLDDVETCAAYLAAAVEEEDGDLLAVALTDVAQARGLTRDGDWTSVLTALAPDIRRIVSARLDERDNA
jgi:hypothetical protein